MAPKPGGLAAGLARLAVFEVIVFVHGWLSTVCTWEYSTSYTVRKVRHKQPYFRVLLGRKAPFFPTALRRTAAGSSALRNRMEDLRFLEDNEIIKTCV